MDTAEKEKQETAARLENSEILVRARTEQLREALQSNEKLAAALREVQRIVEAALR